MIKVPLRHLLDLGWLWHDEILRLESHLHDFNRRHGALHKRQASIEVVCEQHTSKVSQRADRLLYTCDQDSDADVQKVMNVRSIRSGTPRPVVLHEVVLSCWPP